MKLFAFLKLNLDEQILLTRTLFLMWKIRLMLWILPFSYTKNFFLRNNENKSNESNYDVQKLVWAVEVSSIFVLKATCLVKAITGKILLSNENYDSRIKIGVLKDNKNNFEAHAWLELHENEIIIGAVEKEYTQLLY
ncbi:lasso peptide biosynthesis B2 protein [Methanobacterium oryzae]|uniref:lasso peptide biosynthesis B2 protein n=1 Tax=Methanobacterium oryzae TaxID=69540 RepID=UPI003D1B0621